MSGFSFRTLAALALFAAISIAPWPAGAVPIVTVPTALSPGDQYRLAFVTRTTHNAISADIAVYNTFVSGIANSQADLHALGTTWTAIASTATVDARDNTGTNPTASTGVPIFGLNDLKIADNNADLWDGFIAVEIGSTVDGVGNVNAGVWTGSDENGLGISMAELGSSTPPMLGNSGAGGPRWIRDGLSTGGAGGHFFYGLSGILTAPPPGPVTGPGSTQANPLLPASVVCTFGCAFLIPVTAVPGGLGVAFPIFIDPPPVAGFEYAVDPTLALFASVTLPTGIQADPADAFSLEVAGSAVASLLEGESFTFTAPVDSFVLRGITGTVAANDPMGFPTGVTVVDPNGNPFTSSVNFNVTMTSIAAAQSPTGIPEPGTLALFAAGLLGLGFLRRRRRHRD